MNINLSFNNIEVNQFNLGSKRRKNRYSLTKNESFECEDKPIAELHNDRWHVTIT